MKKHTLMEFPSPREFFIETPLYYEVNMSMFSEEQSYKIENFAGTIDSYCIECGQNSVFQPKVSYYHNLSDYIENYLEDDEFEVVFKCTRNPEHKMGIFAYPPKKVYSKVAQSCVSIDIRLGLIV